MTTKPKLLLHICCGPCATYPIQILNPDFNITGFFFNPNIYPVKEYNLRLTEVQRYLKELSIPLVLPDQQQNKWQHLTESMADEPEGGKRCSICFEFRLLTTTEYAALNGFQCFTTTLTIGPNKPAKTIFPIAESAARRFDIQFLAIDFKKKDGHKTATRISKEKGMYRQHYCGCEYSIPDRVKQEKA